MATPTSSLRLLPLLLLSATALASTSFAHADADFAAAAGTDFSPVDAAPVKRALGATALEAPTSATLDADPACIAGHSVTVHAVLEFQEGLWAWNKVGEWDLCVNDGGTSEIDVNFKHEPYRAVISINANRAQLSGPAGDGWAFVFTRQDTIDGKASAEPRRHSLVLEPRHFARFRLDGTYATQGRNLRLTVGRPHASN